MGYMELLGAGFSVLWYVILYKLLIPNQIKRLVRVSRTVVLLAMQLFGGVYVLLHRNPCSIHDILEQTIRMVVVIRMGCLGLCVMNEMSLSPLLASAACSVYAIAAAMRTLSTCGLVVALVEFALLALSVVLASKQTQEI
jgi:hypothetical protein